MFWIPAFACGLLSLTVFANQAAGDVLSFWSVATGVIAKIGVLFVGMWLLSLAENAELEDAEQRINLSLWVVPILSIIVVFVIPFSLPWFVQAVMLAVYLPWTWYLLRFSYGVWEMHMHVRWSIRLAVESGDRSIAIEQVKQKLQREAEQIIRPLPPQQPAEDIPLTPPGSLHLPQPQPQPQSQPQPHPCPQPHPQPRPQPRSMRESEM